MFELKGNLISDKSLILLNFQPSLTIRSQFGHT